jgi:hypothetical protein
MHEDQMRMRLQYGEMCLHLLIHLTIPLFRFLVPELDWTPPKALQVALLLVRRLKTSLTFTLKTQILILFNDYILCILKGRQWVHLVWSMGVRPGNFWVRLTLQKGTDN